MNQTKCFSRWKIMDMKGIVTSGMVYPCSLVSTVAWWGTAKGVTLLNLRTSISTASVYGKLQTSYFTSVIFRRPFHNEMDLTIAIMIHNGQPRHFSYWHICYHHKKNLKHCKVLESSFTSSDNILLPFQRFVTNFHSTLHLWKNLDSS